IMQLTEWIEEFRKDGQWRCRVKAKTYRSAPMSFTLQVGDRLLFEPYNYGKLGGGSTPKILGTDMPLFEFQRDVPSVYDDVEYQKNDLALRNPFELVTDHFEF